MTKLSAREAVGLQIYRLVFDEWRSTPEGEDIKGTTKENKVEYVGIPEGFMDLADVLYHVWEVDHFQQRLAERDGCTYRVRWYKSITEVESMDIVWAYTTLEEDTK